MSKSSFNSLNHQFKQNIISQTRNTVKSHSKKTKTKKTPPFFLLKITTILTYSNHLFALLLPLKCVFIKTIFSSPKNTCLFKSTGLKKKVLYLCIFYKLVLVLKAIRLFSSPLYFDKATSCCFFLLEDICLVMLFM